MALLPDGSPLAPAALQRLACDARIQWIYQGPDGQPLGVGETTRTPPPWLRRIIDLRDGGTYRFPGCDHTLGLHAHHIHHWAHHGPTDASNLTSREYDPSDQDQGVTVNRTRNAATRRGSGPIREHSSRLG